MNDGLCQALSSSGLFRFWALSIEQRSVVGSPTGATVRVPIIKNFSRFWFRFRRRVRSKFVRREACKDLDMTIQKAKYTQKLDLRVHQGMKATCLYRNFEKRRAYLLLETVVVG